MLVAEAGITQRKEVAMLILSRHRNEQIIIGNDIIVTVIEIRGDKVRLAIEAPMEIPVHRMEVAEAIKRIEKGDESDGDTT